MQPGRGGRSDGNVRNGARPLSQKPLPRRKKAATPFFRTEIQSGLRGMPFTGWSAIRLWGRWRRESGHREKLSTNSHARARSAWRWLMGQDLRGRRVVPQGAVHPAPAEAWFDELALLIYHGQLIGALFRLACNCPPQFHYRRCRRLALNAATTRSRNISMRVSAAHDSIHGMPQFNKICPFDGLEGRFFSPTYKPMA